MSNAKPLFDMKLAEKIKQIQELTGCSRFHAALALKDSKNDLEAAVEYIFDSGPEKENPLNSHGRSEKSLDPGSSDPLAGGTSGSDDESWDSKIEKVREITGCSSGDAAHALKKSNGQSDVAINFLLDDIARNQKYAEAIEQKERSQTGLQDTSKKAGIVIPETKSPVTERSHENFCKPDHELIQYIQDITRCSAEEARKALKFTDNSLDDAVTKLLDDMHVKSDHMPYAADENQNGSKDGVSNIRKTITLLLLGETGVGKSTLINAFANYLMHETLEDAKDGVQCLIPCHFTLFDKNYKQRTITLGQFGVNERAGTGSATQTTKCYEFDVGRQKIRIIDTPGIGDTRGVDVDGTNMRNLLDFISQYKEINAICILLKPNNSRVTVMFKYCILELLSKLNKSACQNIMFLFTNSRSTFYAPGDTAPCLLETLNGIKLKDPDVNIAFGESNVFCLDNEAFRFLVAKSSPNNVPFSVDHERDYSASWTRSVGECRRMMTFMMSLPPHQVEETISLNKARVSIQLLTQPLGDISKNIAENMEACEAQRKKITEWKGDIESLRGELYTPVVDIVAKPLDKPITACTDSECCQTFKVGDAVKTHYRTICHRPCYLANDDGNIGGNVGLLDCKAFNKYEAAGPARMYKVGETTWHPDNPDRTPNENGEVKGVPMNRTKSENCFTCGHSFKTHVHVFTETEITKIQVINEQASRQMKNKADAVLAQEAQVQVLEAKLSKWRSERSTINESLAMFAYFLRKHGMMAFNDAYEEYLKLLIEMENSLAKKKKLKETLEGYVVQKAAFERVYKTEYKGMDITPEIIQETIERLCQLELCGPSIRQYSELLKKQKSNAHIAENEIKVNLPTTKKKWFSLLFRETL